MLEPTLFQSYPDANALIKAVVTGDPQTLLGLLRRDPLSFFKKCPEITDPAGQTFFNVSAADLLGFFHDADMLEQVKNFAQNLQEEQRDLFIEKWTEQHALQGEGGADLAIFTGENPPTFSDILKSTKTFSILTEPFKRHYEQKSFTMSLIKNRDAIVCYIDPSQNEQWYYVNREDKTLEPIEIDVTQLAVYQDEYNAFVQEMRNMGPSSAMRSSNQHHELIKKIMLRSETHEPIELAREGIHYRRNGITYCDTHYDFNRYLNVYLKCIRLYNVAQDRNDREVGLEAELVWRTELGPIQTENMYLLQCMLNKNYQYLLPDLLLPDLNILPFTRSYEALDCSSKKYFRTPPSSLTHNVVVFDKVTNTFSPDFGTHVDSEDNFAICKMPNRAETGATLRGSAATLRGPGADVVAPGFIIMNHSIQHAIKIFNDFQPSSFRLESETPTIC